MFRRNFERSASIAVIWEFAGSFIQGKEWTLVETVPPRRRISRDPERTIADEGFGRDASLAVMRIDPAAEAKKEEQTARLAEPANEDVEMETESEPQPASAEPASPRTLNTAQQPRPQPRIRSLGGGQLHPFLGGTGGLPGPGTGMTIGGSPANRNSNARQTPGAVASRPTAFTHYPGFPTGGQIRTGFSHEHSGGSGFEGGGRTLAGGGGGPPDGDDGPADDQGGDEERRRREEDERRRRAAFLDSLARGGARAGSGATATSSLLKKDVSSLKDATLNRVAAMVIDPTLPAAALSELKHLSPQLSDALLSHLIATKKLDIHALKRIVARCPVTEVIMDSYRLATDSVLQILGTTTIRKLSLRGCGYLTDDGIRALAPLARHLTYLDLSNVKVTDKACPTIAGLKGLLHLDLSSTKVTISGLRGIARRLGEEPVLETLILNGCSGVTGPTIFEDLKRWFSGPETWRVHSLTSSVYAALKSLEQLSLASLPLTTPLTVPTGTQADVFPNLRILDVSRTKIADVDVQRIVCGFAKLTQLELKGCGGVTAKGLLEIARCGWHHGFSCGFAFANQTPVKALKNLSTLSFPSRELPFDTILPALASNRLPLISLDLEGAADLSDTGLAALPGFSSSLRSLSLAGLRTISLRALVTALSGLDLEKLDLDRVACLSSPFLNADTDEELDFARSIMRYSHLEEISLAQTGVSDRTLELWNGGPVVDTDEGGSGAGLPPPGSSAEKQAQFKRILRKLNLSKCGGITDRGVRCLGGALNFGFSGTVEG